MLQWFELHQARCAGNFRDAETPMLLLPLSFQLLMLSLSPSKLPMLTRLPSDVVILPTLLFVTGDLGLLPRKVYILFLLYFILEQAISHLH